MSRGLPHSLKHLATRRASPEARTLVLNIIKQNGALSVQDLYKHTQREQSLTQEGSSSDADSDGIIPSMRYLKKVVLPDLQQRGELDKVHAKEQLSEEAIDKLKSHMTTKSSRKHATLPSHVEYWRWQIATPKPQPQPVVEKKPFGTEVGVGENWAHLNKRRQRAREEKVSRDVDWLKELALARKQATASS
ncbi:hypothetical protein L226DRAFT_480194 [Lentinus tigrinus ALCF2SS1-7]|uniref:Uncharacterized protein n=1 Tax=Lentinus tigrinus ALCF2SS1-6 TaxID=1328759 RepID=A0A5C2SN64_9APHY|nr:hypothetical protein L227DRAFT_539960 [Lentinus tigrinus ALCF2SS1-6]RPD79350.1 hypothetical protein L226DRAFT_480194 [Lentinus tigrinus ALCF2SS1-7]